MTAPVLQLELFGPPPPPLLTLVRPTDLLPARKAAIKAAANPSKMERHRMLVLRLLDEHDWLTMFCPFVLMPKVWDDKLERLVFNPEYKQTAIGPRFKQVRDCGWIELFDYRKPRDGADSVLEVSAFRLTAAGREHLRGAA